jgi:rubrerythrin
LDRRPKALRQNELYYNEYDKLENLEVMELLKSAIQMEMRELKNYKNILKNAKDESTATQLSSICNEEERHIKILQQIYYEVNDEFVSAPIWESTYSEDFRTSIKNCIEREFELVRLYSKLQRLIPITPIKGLLYGIISDEQMHAARMIALYSDKSEDSEMHLQMRLPVTVETKPVKSKSENIEFDLRVPVIKGISNQSVQKQINNAIESDIMEFKSQMQVAADENSALAKSQGKQFIPYVASTNYAVTYDKNSILSISVLYHEYVGGKHVYIRSSYNYDIRNGKSLGLREIFKPGINYRELINKEVRKQLQANPNIYSPGAAANFKGIAEDQPYYLEGDNLVIYFGFNQIAPAVSEIPVIRIPLSRFKSQLRPEYFS